MSLMMRPIHLVGTKVELTPMNESHIGGLFDAGRYPEIWTYMSMPMTSVEDMERFVSKALAAKEKGTDYPFVVIDRETEKIIGSTRFLDISYSDRHLEIGSTWLTPSAWRTRVNTECKYLLLKHCFEEMDLVRVQIKTDGRNTQSQRAIERLGAVKERVLRRHRVMHDGYIRDSVYYSVIDNDWPQVRERLRSFLAR